MSLENSENKEKSSIINLDSDSSFDKKSLAKSIPINELENSKTDEVLEKDYENSKISKLEENGNSKISNFNLDKISHLVIENSDNEASKNNIVKNNLEKSDDHYTIENISSTYSSNNGDKLIENNFNNLYAETDNNIYNKYNVLNQKIYLNKIIDKNSNAENNNQEIMYYIIHKLDEVDKNISSLVHDLQNSKNVECIIYIFARLFNPDFIASYFILICSYKYFQNDYLFFLKPLLSTVICLIVSLYLKKNFGRPRPLHSVKSSRFIDLRKHENNCSMPSGDSVQAGNFAVIIYIYLNTNVGFFLVPFVMFARIYFYCHYLFDTIVGAFLGLIISACVNYTLNNLI